MLAHRTTMLSQSGTSLARAAAKAAMDAGLDIIDLSAGEITASLPTHVKDGAIDAIHQGINTYTDTIGIPELREAIASKVARETGQGFMPGEIAVTAGAKQALFNAAMVLLDPGDEVIVPMPCWGTFAAQVQLAGASVVALETRAASYVPRLVDIVSALTPRTRAIIINTPNNPTGSVYDEETLGAIAELALVRDIWVIFDECYGTFTHDGRHHHSIIRLVPEVRSRTVIVNAFSKSLAMTGWRIGYMAAPASVISAVKALQSHTTSNPNVIAQHAVLRHLEHADGSAEASLQDQLGASRNAGLSALALLQDVPLPTAAGGFYFYLDLTMLLRSPNGRWSGAAADDVVAALIGKAGVVTVSGTAFGDPHGLRLSYGLATERVREGCERLVTLLNGAWPHLRGGPVQ